MLINIRIKYLALVFVIQKKCKDKIINSIETILKIIRHHKFMKKNEKNSKTVLQTLTWRPAGSKRSFTIPKRLCKNQKYINMSFILYYDNYYWIKYLKLRQKYALN